MPSLTRLSFYVAGIALIFYLCLLALVRWVEPTRVDIKHEVTLPLSQPIKAER